MMPTMTDATRDDDAMTQLQHTLERRVHPYVSVAPRPDGYVVNWIGTPTEEQMRTAVTEALAEALSPLDPDRASYRRAHLDLGRLVDEAVQLTAQGSGTDQGNRRVRLETRLRTLYTSGGTLAVMTFMKTLRESSAER